MANQDIIVPDPAQIPMAARLPLSGVRMAALLDQPAVKRALPGLAFVSATALAAIAYWSLQSPAQKPLFTGLADGDKAAIAEALQSSGLAYTLDPATGAIAVGEDDVHRARMLLAGQGLPKAAPTGDALISAVPMGSSRAVEGEALRGAREADLARTIEAIDAVKTARIHLATPEASVFVRDTAVPTASVMLTMQQGRSLSQAQVRAMRHLVASSVPGMTPDQVSVVDQSGALLSQPDINGNDRNFALQIQIEDRYRQALAVLLAPILGADNYSAEVHADVDFSESQSTRESYPKDDRALRREEGNRTSGGPTDAVAIGIPGALSNQPPSATQIAATPTGSPVAAVQQTTNESAETYARSFDVGREISVQHRPQGSIARLTIAVALRETPGAKPRSAKDIAAIEGLVKGAIGFNAARGDVVAISSRPFVVPPEIAANLWDAPWFIPAIRQGSAALVALLLLIFVGRPMVKTLRARQVQSAADTAIAEQLMTATDNSAAPRSGPITLDMIEAAPSYEARAALVRNFVQQDAERAAMVVRQLMEGRGDDR
jgi:flagellar M-ring protein FliF